MTAFIFTHLLELILQLLHVVFQVVFALLGHGQLPLQVLDLGVLVVQQEFELSAPLAELALFVSLIFHDLPQLVSLGDLFLHLLDVVVLVL